MVQRNSKAKAQALMLCQRARDAGQMAWAPYSGYCVGAALLTRNRKVYPGCNVENAAYPLCMCAERVAMYGAAAAGEDDFVALAVATFTSPAGTPCGGCRQVMHELGPNMRVYLCSHQDDVMVETTVKDLLPMPFGDEHLQGVVLEPDPPKKKRVPPASKRKTGLKKDS